MFPAQLISLGVTFATPSVNMPILVVDTGQDLVGIFSVDDETYVPYRGAKISEALHRIGEADEVVTYNGKNHDLQRLGAFAGLTGDFPFQGVHTDMRSICWSDRIWGSDLSSTYAMHFHSRPDFPKTHEGSNHLDTYMTFKLWQAWKSGKLRILDGQRTAEAAEPFVQGPSDLWLPDDM